MRYKHVNPTLDYTDSLGSENNMISIYVSVYISSFILRSERNKTFN